MLGLKRWKGFTQWKVKENTSDEVTEGKKSCEAGKAKEEDV